MFASNTSQVSDATFIEDVFSTYLYTGNGSTQTITNGIDLAGKGGLVWVKGRSGATDHALYDTARGATKDLVSNSTAAETTQSTGLTAFSSTGFSLGALAKLNTNAATYSSWTFREQPKFFDVVTFTGDGTTNKVINHSLGSTPGFIVVKRTDNTGDWQCWHTTFTTKQTIFLNQTTAVQTYPSADPITINSTSFTIGTNQIFGNANGGTYVAYLFAHDAGGFGLSGTDNVISCGSYTTDGSGNATVNLGYEPQWVLTKASSGTDTWHILDVMRGFSQTAYSELLANSGAAESTNSAKAVYPEATGFSVNNNYASASTTYIYIAIRRGPMKVPTSGTSVYTAAQATSNVGSSTWTTNFPVDLALFRQAAFTETGSFNVFDRLRGKSAYGLLTAATDAESSYSGAAFDLQTTFQETLGYTAGINIILEAFRRAPGFFDEVCYTGTGANRTVTHNLGVVPELMIVKRRNTTGDWWVYDAATGNTKYQVLSSTATPVTSAAAWNNTTPTSSVFTVGTGSTVNASGGTYVAYLFASCPGVSKVGSYTGSGTTKQIDCGFTAGARFVLIKRTDSTGDWYVWDSARGIVAGNDPYLLLNSTAAEVTSTDYVDTYSAGFEISSTAPAAINANGGTFIFLAIS